MIEPIDNLINLLSRLPSIGKKSAQRLTLHLLTEDEVYVRDLAIAIKDIKSKVFLCKECFNYSESELCPVCSSTSRDRTVICVVERASDIFSIEKIGLYKGLYHVLGGVISPINGITPDRLNISALIERVRALGPSEIIMGLGSNSDSETTVHYITKLLADTNIKVSRFARGIPIGAELEFVDQLTLNRALSDRTVIN